MKGITFFILLTVIACGAGFAQDRNAETFMIPSNSVSFRGAWAAWHKDRADHWLKLCRRAGASHLELPVDEDAAKVLSRFFTGRGAQ